MKEHKFGISIDQAVEHYRIGRETQEYRSSRSAENISVLR